MEILPKYPIIVELIELRENGEETFFLKARRRFGRTDKISYYQIKGVSRRIPAPAYRHLVNTPKGKLLRLYSPSPDEYYVVPLVRSTEKSLDELRKKGVDGLPVETREEAAARLLSEGHMPASLEIRFDEDMKSWLSDEIDRSHRDWSKQLINDRLVIFIMLFIIAILMVATTKISTDAQKESAAAAAGAAQAAIGVMEKQVEVEESFEKVLHRIHLLLDEQGVPSDDGDGTIIVTPPI